MYSELDAINPGFFNTASQAIFVRGDMNDDGLVNNADVALLTSAIADPTMGGQFTTAVGQEYFDLTGDGLLDDSLFMAARWQAFGNRAELAVYPDCPHGFMNFPIALAKRAHDRIDGFLAETFGVHS